MPSHNDFADRFTDALGRLEKERDVEPITMLFDTNAEVGNVIAPEKFHGPEGARDFWIKYRNTFESLRSTFRNRILGDGRIALEWTTEGTSGDGNRVEYEGVSILEVQGGKITRFRAYFDAGSLARQMESADMRVTQQ